MPPKVETVKTKIEVAIYDAKLRLEKIRQDMMLLARERDVVEKHIDTLETINSNNQIPD